MYKEIVAASFTSVLSIALNTGLIYTCWNNLAPTLSLPPLDVWQCALLGVGAKTLVGKLDLK